MKVIKSNPKAGLYMCESIVEEGNISNKTENGIINIYDEVCYQQILGFGGAFTESAAYNYSLMSDDNKKAFLRAYFDRKEGIGYNFGRTHINSCDFALDIYTYVKEGDKKLESFDISREKKYVIPFIKDALKYTGEELVLFSSPWSPPAYMKDNNDMVKGGKLLEEYKELWALYYAKYIKEFAKEGIKISAITVQNEPHAVQTWESCQYSAGEEASFLKDYLIPVLDREGLSDVKIIIWDHNKERVYDHAKEVLENSDVNKRVWAVGHHWYSGDHFEGLRLVHDELHKPLICTEFCGSIEQTDSGIDLAEKYAKEMIENFNHFDIASCDWNLMLNAKGGPYHNRSQKADTFSGAMFDDTKGGCYAPILYDAQKDELLMTPVYYYIGHFSKYIMRGAKRIAFTKYTDKINVCSFINPDGQKVVIILNKSEECISAIIRTNDKCTYIDSEAHSIMTVLF